jgi:hypothetical protein
MDIRSAQKLVWENKVAKGFNTTDVPLEFCLLQGEVAEAFDAWRKGREDLGEELATRVYRPLPNGTLAKIPTEADDEA